MKILLAPASFKGSLTAAEAASAMAEGIERAIPGTDCVCLPLADGSKGTTEALVTATGGRIVPATVTGPLGMPVKAAFGLLGPSGETAVVEMASAAGRRRSCPAGSGAAVSLLAAAERVLRRLCAAETKRFLESECNFSRSGVSET